MPSRPPPPSKRPTTSKQNQNQKQKQKPKLSQTRLDTPLKLTPKKQSNGLGGGATGGIAKSKAKPKANGSILSFFKKAPVEEEGLFIAGLGGAVGGEGDAVGVLDEVEGEEGGQQEVKEEQKEEEEEEEEEDGRGSGLDHEGSGGEGDEGAEGAGRFNEDGGSVKRRRLSVGFSSAAREGGSNSRDSPSAVVKVVPSITGGSSSKKRAGNPFLDEDSDEDDEDDEKRVRLPPPLFPAFDDDGSDRRKKGVGSAELTNGTTISRAPLLRQQTSGADLGADYGMDEVRDGDLGDDDKEFEVFDDGDFTGEELAAMRYMEGQARLEAGEAEEEGEEYEMRDDDGEAMTESCPVCGGSLAGTTPDQATAHVNSCLDGNPTPLPKPSVAVLAAEAAAVSKRFAKAAVARPGQANPISLGDQASSGPSNSAFAKLMSGHAENAAWATAAAAETSSRGMPAYKRTCPFYKIMPGFSICVDAFRYGAVEGCQAYFLSHFHSDHYIGLTASWTHGPIYCSKVTGSLVKLQLKTAAKYVVELEFEKMVPVPEAKGVTVTMIPANHCPGSSLFLFEKTTGARTQRILHCGDFRACPAHTKHPQLRPETVDAITGRTKQQKIDVCYLDTTYLNPRYSFPPQQDVVQACADLCTRLNRALLAGETREWDALLRRQRTGNSNTETVTKFFAAAAAAETTTTTIGTTTITPTKPSPPSPNTPHNPNRLLVVCGTYSIGKERICVAIAQALQTKIYAPPPKLRICRQLDDPILTALLTPDPAEAQVHMQMLMELRTDTLGEYLEGCNTKAKERLFSRVVGFRPSGWNFRPSTTNNNTNGTTAATTAPPIGANLAPGAVPITQLLHGRTWRARFGAADLVPQRGATAEAMCFGAPYSEHSSFRELALFVMALRIERVVPTVNVGSEPARRRMKGWIDRWVAERRRGGVVRVLDDGGEGEGEGDNEGRGDGGDGDRKGEGGGVQLWEGKDGRGGGVYW